MYNEDIQYDFSIKKRNISLKAVEKEIAKDAKQVVKEAKAGAESAIKLIGKVVLAYCTPWEIAYLLPMRHSMIKALKYKGVTNPESLSLQDLGKLTINYVILKKPVPKAHFDIDSAADKKKKDEAELASLIVTDAATLAGGVSMPVGIGLLAGVLAAFIKVMEDGGSPAAAAAAAKAAGLPGALPPDQAMIDHVADQHQKFLQGYKEFKENRDKGKHDKGNEHNPFKGKNKIITYMLIALGFVLVFWAGFNYFDKKKPKK